MKWLFSNIFNKKPKQPLSGLNRSPEKYIKDFIDSLIGYRKTTIRTYRNRLLTGHNCFLSFLKKEKIKSFNSMTVGQLEEYVELIRSHVSDRTANGYVTVVRQLFKYLLYNGHITENIALQIHLPETLHNTETQTIKPELVKELLNTEYGHNPLTKSRNSLIIHLLIKTGLSSLEISNLEMGDLERRLFKNLTVISATGKSDIRRDVYADPETTAALNKYISIRGAYLTLRGIIDNTLILTQGNPSKGWKMNSVGIAAIVRRVLQKMQLDGCSFNLKGISPLIMKKTADMNDWEPKFIEKGEEIQYLRLKEAFLKGDKGFMNRYRIIKE